MRVIVCPHELAMGGSQLNAIELAARLHERGHQVLVFAPEGELGSKVVELGLEHVISPTGTRLSMRWIHQLGQLAKSWNADVVHTYEWAPSLGAACRLVPFSSAKMVMTVLSMDVPDFIPRQLPLILGTEELRQSVVTRSGPVYLMEPPIDTTYNSSPQVHASLKIAREPDELVLSMVCRITGELDKAAGVLEAIEAVRQLEGRYRLKLLVAGDGDAMDQVRQAAEAANSELGRQAVVLYGNLGDPRAVYAVSDICLGMGSSAIKALSFGKPLIVQGSGGYWKVFTEGTMDEFLWQGFYGQGGLGTAALIQNLETMCQDTALRTRLGAWGREVAVQRFSLQAAAGNLERIYLQALESTIELRVSVLAMARSAYDYMKFIVATRIRPRLVP